MINPSHLEAIRDRYANGFGDIEVAAEDVASLLGHVDEVDRQLTEISGGLEGVLATARLLLAFRLKQDGHAATLGAALALADDIEKVRALYPVPA